MDIILIALFAAVGACIAIFIFIAHLLEKRRREALRRAAQQLGLSFDPKPSTEILPGSLPLFTKGHSRRATNLIKVRKNDIALALFDYHYTVGYGKNQRRMNQTVLWLTLPNELPGFTLTPETFLHRIGDAFGIQDIDFDDSPAFSKKYALRGKDEPAVRACFTADIRRHLEESAARSLEANGKELIAFTENRRIKPELLATTIQEGVELAKRFSR